MPTKTKEHTLYAPGNLIKTRTDIYSTAPSGKLDRGTLGLILERGDEGRLLVQFTGNITWWVNQNEIEPPLL